MATETLLIVNAQSGRWKKRKWTRIYESLCENLAAALDVVFTRGRLHATILAQDALKSGYLQILVLGGDGSINEAINGFFENGKPINPQAKLGIIPLGTGNDLIKTLSIPNDPLRAIGLLNQEFCQLVDVGKATYANLQGKKEERYFINIAQFGFGGAVVSKLSQNAKRFGGRISFLWGIISAARYRNQPIEFSVDSADEKKIVIRDFTVANGRFFGGGFSPAPQAKIDDGLFDIVCFGDISNLDLFYSLPMLIKGTHLTHPKVRLYRGRKVSVRSDHRVLLELDGDVVGTLPAEFHIIPRCLRIIAPAL